MHVLGRDRTSIYVMSDPNGDPWRHTVTLAQFQKAAAPAHVLVKADEKLKKPITTLPVAPIPTVRRSAPKRKAPTRRVGTRLS